MASSPSVPSVAVPERITPIAQVALILCQRFEEVIDRPRRRARPGARAQDQDPPGDAQVPVRRDDVDVIRLDAQVVRDFADRERRRASEQLRERAVVLRIEMLHEHESHARVEREVLEQRRESLEPAAGRADAHDRKRPGRE
jgi:hypothetical protein